MEKSKATSEIQEIGDLLFTQHPLVKKWLASPDLAPPPFDSIFRTLLTMNFPHDLNSGARK
ncbi:MAG: hypothetical protein AAFY34_14590 [Pseudomonadota bacterium]